MVNGLEHQKAAAESGYWPLYRFDPRRAANGEAPLTLDSADPKSAVEKLMATESRFQLTDQHDHARYTELVHQMERQIKHRVALYHELSQVHE